MQIGRELILGRSVVEIQIIGIRAQRLPAGLHGQPIQRIIMAGFGGALDPTLAIGDVVLDGLPLPKLHVDGQTIRRGKIHTARNMIATVDEKAHLFKSTGAIAVDMEGEMVRGLAESIGAAFLHVRAISDTATDTLHPAILGLVDEIGRARPWALMTGLLRRPNLIPHLARLGIHSKRAGHRLGATIRELVTSQHLSP